MLLKKLSSVLIVVLIALAACDAVEFFRRPRSFRFRQELQGQLEVRDQCDGLLQAIVARAQQDPGKVDYSVKDGGDPKGWQYLAEIYKAAKMDCLSSDPAQNMGCSQAMIKSTWRPLDKDWCGIFCTYIYKQVGVNVDWTLNGGVMVGDGIQKAVGWDAKYKGNKQTFLNEIKPGYVVIFTGNLSHHSICETIDPSGQINTIDGNQEFGRIAKKSRPSKNVIAYYMPSASACQAGPTSASTTPDQNQSPPDPAAGGTTNPAAGGTQTPPDYQGGSGGF